MIPRELSLSSLLFDDGWHAMRIIRDITTRKEITTVLHREQEFTRLLLDTSPAHFSTTGGDGGVIRTDCISRDYVLRSNRGGGWKGSRLLP